MISISESVPILLTRERAIAHEKNTIGTVRISFFSPVHGVSINDVLNFLVPSRLITLLPLLLFKKVVHGCSVLNFGFVYRLLAVEEYSGGCWLNQGAGDDFASKLLLKFRISCFPWHYIDLSFQSC